MAKASFLFLFVVVPGLILTAIALFFLFPEWVALENSHQNFMAIATRPDPTFTQLYVAQAAENRHRINCFAEGVGVLMGVTIVAIGVHGMVLVVRR